jgi:hypothetical protein
MVNRVSSLDFVRDALLGARADLTDYMLSLDDDEVIRYERLSEALDVAVAQVELLGGVVSYVVPRSLKYPLESFESSEGDI